jgi:predicted nucleic acid-binding protein
MRSVEIARRYGLSIYDATYLELAERVSLPLASFDAKLLKAGKALRVPAAL